MPSDIVRKLSEDDGSPAPAPKARAIEQLWKADGAPPPDAKGSPVKSLTSGIVIDATPKQQGNTRVGIITPYACDDVKPIIAALAEIKKPKGLNYPPVGAIFHEGSEKVGRDFPRHAPMFNFLNLVRDHPDHLKNHKHLGGSGLFPDVNEEIRFHLDEADRLARRDAKDAIDDVLDLGLNCLVVVPGSARIAYATEQAFERRMPVLMAAMDEPALYINDIEPEPLPITILIVTAPDFADTTLLIAYVLHLMASGMKVAAVFYTPSVAGERLAAATLGEGAPVRMKLKPAEAEQLLECLPDMVLLTPGYPLADAVGALSEQRQIPVFDLGPASAQRP